MVLCGGGSSPNADSASTFVPSHYQCRNFLFLLGCNMRHPWEANIELARVVAILPLPRMETPAAREQHA